MAAKAAPFCGMSVEKNLRRKHIARHYVYVCTVKDHKRGPCAQPVNNEQQTTN